MVQRWGVRRGAVSINNYIVRAQLIYIYRPPPPSPSLALAPAPALALALPLLPILPLPTLPLPALTATRFALTQHANPVRLPWAWAPYGKTTAAYTPTTQGKWWSQLAVGLAAIGPNKQRDWGHISWIIETELGVELVDSKQYATCQALGDECQVYSKKGAQQVSRPGDTYARCQAAARSGGCSLLKRKRKDPKDPSPPPPGLRSLAAYKPSSSLLPGPGSSGITA